MLNSEGIKFPLYWDEDAVAEAFNTKTTLELYDFFGCANATAFTRMMKKVFTTKPETMSYSDYVKTLLVKERKPIILGGK